jgi:hypothetical protein
MAFVVKAKGNNFSPPPAGSHVARVDQVLDLGLQKNPFKGTEERKVKIRFELPNELMSDGKPHVVSKFLTVSLHEKASLRKVIKGILGRDLTKKEDDEGYDIFQILGKSCLVTLIHKAGKDNSVNANIDSVLRFLKA